MSGDPNESHARVILEEHGFTVEPIAEEGDAKRADFEVTDSESTYILEVKGRGLTEKYRGLLARSHDEGHALLDRSTEPGPRFSNTLKEAAAQLAETPCQDRAFHVVWISDLGTDSSFSVRQCERNLYGLADLTVMGTLDDADSWTSRPCYFYHHSDLYRHRDIDAVVVGSEREGKLCLNPFSGRLLEFRQTRLFRMFPKGAVCDPSKLEAEGRAFIVSGEVDRRDARAVGRYVFDKYQVRTSYSDEHHISTVMSIPMEDLPRDEEDAEQSN